MGAEALAAADPGVAGESAGVVLAEVAELEAADLPGAAFLADLREVRAPGSAAVALAAAGEDLPEGLLAAQGAAGLLRAGSPDREAGSAGAALLAEVFPVDGRHERLPHKAAAILL